MMLRNPYETVDWSNTNYISSVSHAHINNQEHLDNAYAGGVRHLPASNYYPSKPFYPLEDKVQNVPTDLLSSPNAEHYGATNSNLHFNCIGSMKTWDGVGGTWQYGFDEVVKEMIYKGGITINHPIWSGSLSYSTIKAMMQYRPEVLGIEVFNAGANANVEDADNRGWAINTWDRLLSEGVYTLGFFGAPDHGIKLGPDFLGRNILLTPEWTEEACGSSYQDGAFYGKMYNTDFKFTNIMADNEKITVSTDTGVVLRFISQLGTTVFDGKEATYNLTGDEMFVRIEAEDINGERLFTQPIQYSTVDKKEKRKRSLILL